MIERVNFCADDEQTKRQDAKRQIWTHFKPPFKGSHNLEKFRARVFIKIHLKMFHLWNLRGNGQSLAANENAVW